MSFFIYDADAQQTILRLKAHAEAHPFSLDDMLDMHNKAIPLVGERQDHCCHIQHMKIVFSYEEHPFGMVRHFSVSDRRPGRRYPDIFAVAFLLEELGFQNKLTPTGPPNRKLLIDELEGEGIINIIEYVD